MNPVVVREIDDSEISRFPPRTLAAVLVAAGFALSALGHVLFAQDGLGGYLWLPSGLMVAALLRSAPASWPLLLLAGLAGESANGLLLGLTPAEIADRFATTAAVALLGAILVRKFQAKAVRLDSVRDLLWFVLFTVAIAPLLGVAVATALQGPFASLTDFAATVLPRWASNSVGVLALAPFLMVWSQPRQEGVEPENGPRRSEVVAMALATVA